MVRLGIYIIHGAITGATGHTFDTVHLGTLACLIAIDLYSHYEHGNPH